MLYHVPEVDRAIAELVRVLGPSGRLVAATNSVENLIELWSLVGGSEERYGLRAFENGAKEVLRRRFGRVRARGRRR